jgi:hypothetical protein
MSRAHQEIVHQARLLERIADGLVPADATGISSATPSA